MVNSDFNQIDFDLIEDEFDSLMKVVSSRCRNQGEIQIVRKAFDFANQAHKNVRRRSGEPYIIHPIAVARIVVCDIGLGYKSITAALLHDVVEDTSYTIDDIRILFGDKIATLVDGLTKIKTVLDNADDIQTENLKRMLLTLNDDVRVVLIKLADRLHNCRTIDSMPDYKRDKILSETMFIFIPLAHRLGLYSVKCEMEDIWLRYNEPEVYEEINTRIEESAVSMEGMMDDFIEPMKQELTKAGTRFNILTRVKSTYSVWKKMKTKMIPFEQVYDLFAVRIIFDSDDGDVELERRQAYMVFAIITGMYRFKPDRVRDWIRQPKSNGYEALHCTLMSKAGVWIEVQIRSRRMDEIAERGIAAHWLYKEHGYASENDSEMDKWLAKVKQILQDNADNSSTELLDIIHQELVTNDIVVFTPKGEQRKVANGSTALDFAFSIHTRIGLHAIATKINNKVFPLSTKLKTGDVVEIITADNGNPQLEWLQFLRGRRARNEVIGYLREQGKYSESDEKGNSDSNQDSSDVQIRVELTLSDPGIIADTIERLKQIQGVNDVTRIDI